MKERMSSHGYGRGPLSLLALACVTGFFLWGCVSDKAREKDPFFEKWKQMAEASRGHSPALGTRTFDLPAAEGEKKPAPVARISKADIKGQEPAEEAKKRRPLPTEKVTMAMRNTDVNVILRALARSVGQNIMMNEGVTGVTNINVKDTPWDQVFKAILATRGLTYTWEGDIIRVMTIQDMKHELDIDKVEKDRFAQKIEREELEPLRTRIFVINYADAVKMSENLQKLLGDAVKDPTAKEPSVGAVLAGGRQSVMVDEHNNALIVNAGREDLENISKLVMELDRPTPQIRIEANIVETTRETARELGVQWGGLYHGTGGDSNYWITPGISQSTTGTTGTTTTTSTGGILGNTVDTAVSPTLDNMAVNFPSDLVTETGKGLTLGFASQKLGGYLLNAQLSALQQEGKLHILSSPSITTQDNQTAFTENGEKVPFATINEDGDREVSFEDAVLRLEITPHVIDGKNLKMKILVKKDEVDLSRTVEGNPFIIKKQTETTLIVRDGETVVISGLSKERGSETQSGVPLLKDIPILGRLFRTDGSSGSMEDVLVFITPHILEPWVARQ